MDKRLLLGILLLAAPVWAEDWSDLEQEVEWMAGQRAPTEQLAGPQQEFHALFYGEDPARVIFTVGGWWATMSGPIKFDGEGSLDVADTFGLDDQSFVPTFRLGVRIAFFELVFEAWWFGAAGTAVVDEEFEIDGVVFEVNEVIDSTLQFQTYKITFEFALVRYDFLTATIEIGANAMRLKGSVTTVATDKRATFDQWLPLPMIGISFKGYFVYPWLYEANFNWIGFSTSTFSATALDVRLAVGYEINDWINFKVGYRFFTVDVEVDAVTAEVDLSGFFLEFGFMF